MNRNWLDKVSDVTIIVAATSMLVVYVCLAQELIGTHLEGLVCERYAPVCSVAARLRQPIKLFAPKIV